MKQLGVLVSALALLAATCGNAAGQTPGGADQSQLEVLARKIDEQNAKIDALSQQILKLEQQVAAIRPGVMIGEPTPAPGSATSSAAAAPAPQSGSNHVVAKGETLTSIAKMHRVTVEELQKVNHIENDRKLQIGQTLILPASASSPATGSSASPTTPNG